ncbi:MAG TPA: tRNA dihydrouridine synthase DusB [Candidatus Angelobacter sp.]|nr:tRNA dihydrouridine synthase DusB [Candidatus Angelobacter sp.]
MHKFWENPATAIAAPEGARVPKSVQIGNVRIAPATILAPMAGVTDTVFRRFIRNASFVRTAGEVMQAPELMREPNQNHGPQSAAAGEEKETSGCGLLMTEFTSADGLFRTRKSKRERYLHFYDDEHPISAQLFGSDPYTLAESARIVEDAGFDLVDLNLGCPAKRVVKCNGGSGLLKDLPVIKTIFEAMRAAVKIPFTVKFRLGWDDQNVVCVNLARMAQECGLNAVALHARTREQGYSGDARWDWIAAVKDAVTIPVTGNGDIRRPEDAIAMVAQTGCDAVMIGRTAASNPWIFRQIRQHAESGRYDQPTEADRYQMIRTYFRMLIDETGRGSPGKMKQFVAWFTHGVPNGGALRRAVYSAKEGPEILASVEAFFEALLSGRAATAPAMVDEPAELDLLPACGD